MRFTWKVNRYAHENTGALARTLEQALNDLEGELYHVEKIEFCTEPGVAGKSVLVVAKKQLPPTLPPARSPPYFERTARGEDAPTLLKTDVRK